MSWLLKDWSLSERKLKEGQFGDGEFARRWSHEDKHEPLKNSTGFAISIPNCPLFWSIMSPKVIATSRIEAV